MRHPSKKTSAKLIGCILLSWLIGWFALQSIGESDRDYSLPPKPVPRYLELFVLALPLTISIAMSGNAHDPSTAGLWIGLFVQWTATGIGLFFLLRLAASVIGAPRAHAKKA